MSGRHCQTLLSTFLPRQNLLPPPEDCLVEVEPATQVLCRCNWQPNRSQAMTLIIVHGLEGSSESQYVIGTGSKAWTAGMNVVRMNVRNCGGTEKLAPTLYNSGLSGDVGAVMRYFITQEKLQGVALVGFSMGGNMVLKLAGELGKEVPPELKAVCGISPAIDLSASVDLLHQLYNRLYEWHFVWGLRHRYLLKGKLFPGRFDPERARGIRSVRDFDDRITAHYFQFNGAEDYYTRASAAPVLDRIAVPTLVVHALDDPFITMLPPTREMLRRNPNVRFVETAAGGHCAFLAAADGYDGRWAERQMVEFLRTY